MGKTKSKKGTLAFKVDLEKAYDRVDWWFLEATLMEFGFPNSIVYLIMCCIKSSSLSILWNGSRLESFSPSRGLRQGDPLSPYLFVLCMEKLAVYINKKVDNGVWSPVAVSRGGPRFSHLLFADDVMLFCKASSSQVKMVLSTLNDFCMASGMKVNFDKSRVLCSKNVSRTRRDNFTNISSIRFTTNLGKYLGVPLRHGRVSRSMFSSVLEKINKGLASWKGSLLNQAGRVCLAKSVIASIPIHQMQVMFVLKGIRNEINRVTRHFIWKGCAGNRSLSLVQWNTLVTPKTFGGLGVRDAHSVNLALLGKLMWALLHDTNKAWVQVLGHKYFQNASVLEMPKINNASYVCKSIVKAAKALMDGFGWNIGDSQKSFWYDTWLPFGPLCNKLPFVHITDFDLKLSEVWRDGAWDLASLHTPLPDDLV